jgi:hypothetical protein
MRIPTLLIASTLILTQCCPLALAAAPKALPQAHAHNDYYHKRPLLDALERGFVSVEADVFLVDGQLLVGHYAHELRPERTLESLYLKPLSKHVRADGGRVFEGDQRLSLLVDFKTDGKAAYDALDELLGKYEEMISTFDGDKTTPRAVDVIVTGDRPVESISRDKQRRVAVDGRLADLGNKPSPALMPLVSESWSSHFSWRGEGQMPEEQRAKLRELANQVQDQGRALRFWGTPDDPAVWNELRAAGVDLIGADDLDALQKFLRIAPAGHSERSEESSVTPEPSLRSR